MLEKFRKIFIELRRNRIGSLLEFICELNAKKSVKIDLYGFHYEFVENIIF